MSGDVHVRFCESAGVRFPRATHLVIHAWSEQQARFVKDRVRRRLMDCGLELHPEKTKLVYCKDADRTAEYAAVSFDFLGYTFRPRLAKSRAGKFFVSFLPAVSPRAAKTMRMKLRDWKIASTRNNQTLQQIAALVNPRLRGWANYYRRFYPSAMTSLWSYLERILVRWVCWKYRRFKRRRRAAYQYLGRIARRDPRLFVHWQFGFHRTVQ